MSDTSDPKAKVAAQAEEAPNTGRKPGRGGPRRRAPNPGRKQKPEIKVVEIAPIATPARMRPRHWGLIISFIILVLLPAAVSGWYLWTRAVDQYSSSLGFTARQEGGGSATDFLGGFASQLAGGGSTQSDTDILFEFIQSQEIVRRIDEVIDLRAAYSVPYARDPVFALSPDATFEDLVDYWSRIIRISYDENSRLLKLEVRAFDPKTAQEIANLILEESSALINELNAKSREDSLKYSREDLSIAEDRLKSAREALILFRTKNQTVDPLIDLQARMGVVNTLQQQLAEALVALDLLGENTTQNDPRVLQAKRRIEVIRQRIIKERESVTRGEGDLTNGEDFPTLLAEYEGLIVDREFSEEAYRAALTAYDIARANAERQSSYLAAFVLPTLAQTAEYPHRAIFLGLVVFFLFFAWAIGALVFYSIRDSR